MKRIFRLFVLMSVAVLVAGLSPGCADDSSGTLEVTQADRGSTLDMQVGQQISVTLEANPTTGYLWTVEGEVPGQLQQVGEARYTSESDALGAGGSEVWTFEAVAPGEGTLKLKYWRSFEPDVDPIEEFQMSVSVE
ncbi:MAG: protease inhibitor I42 family protein [Coriobacteriia bacterium]|nr:protease inhibitor I42 family protein [Coriobacteriia bacterium]